MGLCNNTRAMNAICRGIPWLALFLVVGCAPAARRTAKAGSTTTKAPVQPPSAFVDVQRDASGITLTQHVPVSDEVRADYESAVHMLEQTQYDQAIALLLKVTGKAPALTAAHINLSTAYARIGDLDRADASLQKAVESNTQHRA